MRNILFVVFASFCLFFAVAVAPAKNSSGQPKGAERKLNITIVERSEPLNNIRPRTTIAVIQVKEENHRPVAGAAIVIKPLAARGPAGWFFKSKVLTGVTDANGFVKTAPLRLDHLTRLQILASANGHNAAVVVSQAQILAVPSTVGAGAAVSATATVAGAVVVTGVSASVPAIVAGTVSVGAATAGAAVATSKSGDTTAPPPPSITIAPPGSPVFGPTFLPGKPAVRDAASTGLLRSRFAFHDVALRPLGAFEPHYGATWTVLGRLAANRFFRLAGAHISIGRERGINHDLIIGPTHRLDRGRVR